MPKNWKNSSYFQTFCIYCVYYIILNICGEQYNILIVEKINKSFIQVEANLTMSCALNYKFQFVICNSFIFFGNNKM